MKWRTDATGRLTCVVPPDGHLTLRIAPKGDGRWTWEVVAKGAASAMATGVTTSLGAAKNVAEQFAKRAGST